MKNILILFFVILLYGCTISHKSIINNDNLSGVYSVKYFPVLLTIDSNGTYLITNSIDRMEYFYRDNLCDTISTGEWSFSAPNIIDILSDNYYKKQRGFEYNLIKENRLSQDSLYIHVIFSRDYLQNDIQTHPINLHFNFNDDKNIITTDTLLILSKSEYLNKLSPINLIAFSLNVSNYIGYSTYLSRIEFEYFKESINTNTYNYITISLPYLDNCFFEFIPYYHSLIYIKNKNKLFWNGRVWKRSKR